MCGRMLLPVVVALALLPAACRTAHEASRPASAEDSSAASPAQTAPLRFPPIDPVPDDSAAVLVQLLEQEPFAPDAAERRARLFAWLIGSERLGGFDAATRPIDSLERSGHAHVEELTLQYMFGGAVWKLRTPRDSFDLVGQQAAGIRSMIAAYRNMVQRNPALRAAWLDRLDELRRRGELQWYCRTENAKESR